MIVTLHPGVHAQAGGGASHWGRGKGKGKGKGDENPYIDLLVLSIIHGRKKERKKDVLLTISMRPVAPQVCIARMDGRMDGRTDMRSFVVVVVWSIQLVR